MKAKIVRVLGLLCILALIAGSFFVKTQIQGVEDFNAAARNGDAAKQNILGVYYYRGYPYPQDYVRAMKWWRRAADQGYPEAQFYVGRMFWFGEGVPKDTIQGYMWISLAADRNDPKASSILPELEKSMTSKQILEAKRRAAQWKPVPEKKPDAGLE